VRFSQCDEINACENVTVTLTIIVNLIEIEMVHFDYFQIINKANEYKKGNLTEDERATNLVSTCIVNENESFLSHLVILRFRPFLLKALRNPLQLFKSGWLFRLVLLSTGPISLKLFAMLQSYMYIAN
jgi:hypothetical protein